MDKNEFTEAIIWFDKAIEDNPQLEHAYYARGVCMCKQNKHEDAIKW